jgi:hypothetical protein
MFAIDALIFCPRHTGSGLASPAAKQFLNPRTQRNYASPGKSRLPASAPPARASKNRARQPAQNQQITNASFSNSLGFIHMQTAGGYGPLNYVTQKSCAPGTTARAMTSSATGQNTAGIARAEVCSSPFARRLVAVCARREKELTPGLWQLRMANWSTEPTRFLERDARLSDCLSRLAACILWTGSANDE